MKKLDIYCNEKTGEMFFQGISCFMCIRDTKTQQQMEFEKIIGPATKTIIYNATKRSLRKAFANILANSDNKPKEKRNLASKLMQILPEMGYGVFTLEKFDEKGLSFVVFGKNCYNTFNYKNMQKPVCYGMAGILTALFEVVFEKEMFCEEKKCEAMNSECCVFEIRSTGRKMFIEKKFPKIDLKGTKKIAMLFDEDKGEISLSDIVSVVCPRPEMPELEMEFERIIGPVTKTIFYNATKRGAINSLGAAINRNIPARILRRISKKRFISELLKMANIRGLGLIKLVGFDEKNFIVRIDIENSFETIVYEHSEKPICYLMAGVLAGAAVITLDKDMIVREMKCKGMGAEHCEFEIYPMD